MPIPTVQKVNMSYTAFNHISSSNSSVPILLSPLFQNTHYTTSLYSLPPFFAHHSSVSYISFYMLYGNNVSLGHKENFLLVLRTFAAETLAIYDVPPHIQKTKWFNFC